jgi:hypothetical protein
MDLIDSARSFDVQDPLHSSVHLHPAHVGLVAQPAELVVEAGELVGEVLAVVLDRRRAGVRETSAGFEVLTEGFSYDFRDRYAIMLGPLDETCF